MSFSFLEHLEESVVVLLRIQVVSDKSVDDLVALKLVKVTLDQRAALLN
jgi:hypothetical protein